ncbi:Holliday junction branch migration protein RuvA [Patescibacteria group bacterium]|nr:Holliday junction branch migration protein RuvA [Patescibacteria group bacterium]MBU4082382.1 Holliday junction branch migration protein RuvA [Patescibacteria group bacterium]
MLAFLEGKIELKTEKFAIINVGGVGYKVFGVASVLDKLSKGKEAKLFVHLYTRENILDLYGFLSFESLEFFETLISVRGIGPKAALSIMAIASVATLKQAIASGQKALLTKVSGIGQRTAERVILELKDKIVAPIADIKRLSSDSDAIDALVSLGYTIQQARGALEQVSAKTKGVASRVREALKLLGK